MRRERPRAIIVQNPPLPSVVCVALYSRLHGIPFVIDSHSAALVDAKWAWSLPVQRWLGWRAAATMVHTETLLPKVRGAGCVLVLEDPPPSLPPAQCEEPVSTPRVVVIGSFADDEPIAETLSAAARVPNVDFVLTGDSQALSRRLLSHLPRNVRIPGWLSFQAYADLLRSATVIMSLTKRDMTVLRGGWEAVYLGKPLVVSDWPALRCCFASGAVFVGGDPESIAAGVDEALRNRNELAGAMRLLRNEKRTAWENGVRMLGHLLSLPSPESSAPTVPAPMDSNWPETPVPGPRASLEL
jgi:hypothetical protein